MLHLSIPRFGAAWAEHTEPNLSSIIDAARTRMRKPRNFVVAGLAQASDLQGGFQVTDWNRWQQWPHDSHWEWWWCRVVGALNSKKICINQERRFRMSGTVIQDVWYGQRCSTRGFKTFSRRKPADELGNSSIVLQDFRCTRSEKGTQRAGNIHPSFSQRVKGTCLSMPTTFSRIDLKAI